MSKKRLLTLAGAAVISAFSWTASAQTLKVPAPSPSAVVKQNFGLGDITLDYSRPLVKGRTIFGDLVPFGKIWRTGANSATKITFTDDVQVEGKPVKAGTYALYTIPGKNSWTVMLYSDLSLGGNVNNYKEEKEALRVTVTPTALTAKVESFTLNLAKVKPSSATLELMWDRTRVPVKITTDIDTRIMKNIDAAVNTDTRPYFQAANYYYENDKDLAQAKTWILKGVEQNPKAFWMKMLQARIELKMGDRKAAVASAQKVVELATEAKNDDYVKLANDLIAEANKS